MRVPISSVSSGRATLFSMIGKKDRCEVVDEGRSPSTLSACIPLIRMGLKGHFRLA